MIKHYTLFSIFLIFSTITFARTSQFTAAAAQSVKKQLIKSGFEQFETSTNLSALLIGKTMTKKNVLSAVMTAYKNYQKALYDDLSGQVSQYHLICCSQRVYGQLPDIAISVWYITQKIKN